MRITEKTWSWLQSARHLSDEQLLAALKDALVANFDQTFYALKTQKLLSRSRDAKVTGDLCRALIAWSQIAPISGYKRSRVKRHSLLTITFQQVASSLKAKTDALAIWNLSYEDLCSFSLSSVEATALKLLAKLQEERRHISTQEENLEVSTAQHERLRELIDHTVVLLDEGRRRCAPKSNYEVADPAALIAAMTLARNTDSLMTIWDVYSFTESPMKLNGNVVRVYRPTEDVVRAYTIFRRRSHISDLMQQGSYQTQFLDLLNKKLYELEVSVDQTFESFIDSTEGKTIFHHMLPFIIKHQAALRARVSYLVDFEQEVKIGAKRFKYSDLVTGWSFLYGLAYLGTLWTRAYFRSFEEAPATVLSFQILLSLIRNHSPHIAEPESLLELFISREAAHGFQDPFYRPLIEIGSAKFYIPLSIIEIARFDRNLLHRVAREVNATLSEKGSRPLTRLRQMFKKAGFRVIYNYPIRNINGEMVTDLDIAAAKDGYLFIFQSKVLSISDTQYEEWRNGQSLEWAAEQMNAVLENLSFCKPEFWSELDCDADSVLVPLLLTNIFNRSTQKVGGFPVVDFKHLENLLEGAFQKMLDPETFEVLDRFSVLQAQYPSGSELASLLRKLREKPLEQGELIDHTVELEGWKFITPVMSYPKFTDE